MSAESPQSLEFPVSFAQQRLWFLEQLEDPGAAYTVRLPVRLRGHLDAALVQRSVDALVQRHEALRTTIGTRAGVPVQVVAERSDVPVELVAMDGAGEAELRRQVTSLSRHAFRLSQGPLVRVLLVRAAADDHVLLVLMHHAISDGWSTGILFRDFAAIYGALAAGRDPVLPDLPVQYADFAAWQRDWLQGEELERQAAFWKAALAGAPPLLDLPTDRPRPAVQTYRGSRWTRILSRDLTSELRAVSGARGCTPFMTLLATFQALLGRYSGQGDVVVGTPVAGRRRTELEQVIGFFANTLAMRGDLTGNPTFGEVLARVKRTALDAWAHQDLPFEKLVEAIQPARSLSHSPVFQVMFILQNAPWEAAAIPGLSVAPAEADATDAAKFDLTLSATEYEGELWLAFEYNTDLFDAATIERMAGHYETLLHAALREPAARVCDLPLEEPADVRRRLAEWNATEEKPGPHAGIHEMIEESARRNPGAIAVESGGRRWTYGELDDWADMLADRLRALGAGPGVTIGLCLERSPEMVGAVLAILKSGAAYLPLDPSFPEARLRLMLEDSGSAWLVTARPLAGRFPAFAGGVLCIEDLAPAACSATGRRAEAVTPGQDAYLIYTSGSTGRPKGVRITHGAVTNFLQSMLRIPGIAATDRVLAVTTLSFDIAVLELLGPLCAGATVVLASQDDARDGAALARLIGEARITLMQATPATWRALLAGGWRGKPDLRMLCGGEALDPDLAGRLLARGAALWNLYGPTETAIWSTCGAIRDPSDISVGRPIANTQVYVLDDAGRPAPPGVPGELCIGGAGVSPGYHGRPDLTAERFIASPLDPSGRTRLYRTGDRARFLADGRLRVLGRLDTQVKLRGFRIEPGEIEAVLGAVEGVESCAVALREREPGDARLVAWVVMKPGAKTGAQALREALKRTLPGYMVPSAFVMMAALPLTPNGKVDRRSLAESGPIDAWAADGTSVIGPRTAVEETLCDLYAEVLGRGDGIGIHADFFSLGGHSLLATQLVSRIRDVLEVELPLKTLFERPTVAGLAEAMAHMAGRRPDSQITVSAPPVQRRRATTSPLSFTQQRLWFLDQLEPGNAAYNLHAAYRLRGVLDERALEQAVQAVVARHEALRTTFAAQDGEPVQVIHPGVKIPLERVDLGGTSDEQLQAELARRAELPFDLGRGPLLRVALLRCAADEQVLLLVLHHIVSDGWSMAVLLREITQAYAACARGESPQFPPLPVQYADYAQWQRQFLAGDELGRQLGYWRAQLAGAPPLINLPTDRPRLPLQRHRGARLSRDVSVAVVDGARTLGRAEGATLFMVLLAAFDTLLSRYTGDEEVVIGTPVAGRSRTELEGLIGFFVNTLVMRGDLRGNPPFRELLARVKRTALDAYAHPDTPFERIVDELRPPRDPGRTPVFQVMFNLHNEPAQALEFPGLDVMRLGVGRRTSKFDLTVGVVEHANGLTATFEYNTDLFDRETVEQLAESYGAVLAEIARDADQRIGDIEVLGPEARARVRGERARLALNNAFVEIPEDALRGTLTERFAAQVALHPQRLAVSWPSPPDSVGGASAPTPQHWTYAELDQRVRAVAAEIRSAVGDGEAPIALLLGHDGPMIAGLLGVLQSGRAYVPLDPWSPRARNEWVLKDAGACAIVTDEPRLENAAWLRETGLPLIKVDRGEPGERPIAAARATATDGAYLLYTSGTTGHPKGVAQTHANVLGHIRTWTNQLRINTEDRLALFSGYGYDAAVQDIFGALLNGASVHPIDLRGGESAPEIVDRIARERITLLHATPTVYRYLFGGRVTCEQDLSTVRLVVLGGEEARRSDLDLFKLRFPRGARFVNGLGLTECTMALQYFADHDTRVLGERLPIGRPVPGTQALLLDDDGKTHAWTGELALASPHLSPGYHGDIKLTAERFRANPDDPTQHLYLTRDLARRLPDGQLLHAGRRDAQVKIRGIRVEPADVEAALRADQQIRECVVGAHESEPGETLLVAWVVARGLVDQAALRQALRLQLPEYLVPQRIMEVPGLPRLPNGKIDRRALPRPPSDTVVSPAALPPRTEIEQRLAALWCGVLKREAIGVHDDFFALGGHSLLATRLIARVRDAFRLEVPLLALFESPTVAGMAGAIERVAAKPPEPGMPALTRRPRQAAGSAGR